MKRPPDLDDMRLFYSVILGHHGAQLMYELWVMELPTRRKVALTAEFYVHGVVYALFAPLWWVTLWAIYWTKMLTTERKVP